ncbi:MAG: hypothetical protein HYY01_13775 [Chloroflexi bacterium]|nr:hypothetical protein [Chloroflexota bacterium]
MDLWEELFRMRDDQRQQLASARMVVRYEDLPWQQSRQGLLKWYLHPAIQDVGMRTMMVYVQELPPLGRSGKTSGQGGMAFYFWEGSGYTLVESYGITQRYDWEAQDMLVLPVSPEPTTYQHFNGDSKQPARVLVATSNLTDSMGVDMGVGFEQIEDAPPSKQ